MNRAVTAIAEEEEEVAANEQTRTNTFNHVRSLDLAASMRECGQKLLARFFLLISAEPASRVRIFSNQRLFCMRRAVHINV